jgi:hypothetical protein
LFFTVTAHDAATAVGLIRGYDFWFYSETHRAKFEIQFHRADSEDTIWFVALSKEQLALIAENGLHGISFSLRVIKWRKASVTLRPRRVPILFSRQAQPAYICLPSGEFKIYDS